MLWKFEMVRRRDHRGGNGAGLAAMIGRSLLLAGLVTVLAQCSKSEAAPSRESPATPVEVGRCGDKGLPDCPTQAWMKATLQPFLLANDGPRLAEAFEKLAAAAPPGYDDWAALSQSGADAAKSGDMARAKQTCADCHSRHRARFRSELRQRRLL
jgi:hypothetical protein